MRLPASIRVAFLFPFYLLAGIFIPSPNVSAEVGALQNKLQIAFAKDESICRRILTSYSTFQQCPLTESHCFIYFWTTNPGDITKIPEQTGAINTFGYTEVSIAEERPREWSFSIVYLANFQGMSRPYLIETWKVPSIELDKTWNLPRNQAEKNTNADAFRMLLSAGERLSEEISIAVKIDNTPYVIERQCTGFWEYGPSYTCLRIKAISVKKIFDSKQAIPFCRFREPQKPRSRHNLAVHPGAAR